MRDGEEQAVVVGIKDVARHAGVSSGTVSNTLNRPDVVSPLTRAKVLKAIKELGYVPDESARLLRSGESRLLAALVLDLANPFFVDVVRGAELAAQEAGLNLITCNSAQKAESEASHLEMLAQQRVRGVLLCPVDDDSGRSMRSMARSMLPHVLIDSDPSDYAACSVLVDDVRGGQLAAQHLLEMGHRHIALMNGPMRLAPCRDREKGVRAVMETSTERAQLTVLSVEGLDVTAGREAGHRLLEVADRPTAVICVNDLTALGVLQAMTAAGVRVPDEMAIVGYDDIEFASAAAVPLSSVRQPTEQLGRTAARLLIEETDATRSADHQHQKVTFFPELVVRESSRLQR
ncbi:LacI family DNA-binding transcriptional regulator [Streptomyces sp. HUAS TT11]|uniref:LacI family DNA-binding transcriptional regulator n=1 Tax=Streptomyces sp. HUAS TT11 TaxID=3447508 RepID=UPI003F659E57